MPTVSIPFSGFYESSHDAALDSALEQMCSDDNGDIISERHNIAWNAIDWRKVHLAYAQHYSERLADECNATWTFIKMHSPREYNFSTDEIDVTLERAELVRMFDAVSGAALAEMARARLTARSGFIPFYSSDWTTWGALDTWEQPQLSLLVECYCNVYTDADERDWNLVEDCNGEVTAMLEAAVPSDVLDTIYDQESVV